LRNALRCVLSALSLLGIFSAVKPRPSRLTGDEGLQRHSEVGVSLSVNTVNRVVIPKGRVCAPQGRNLKKDAGALARFIKVTKEAGLSLPAQHAETHQGRF